MALVTIETLLKLVPIGWVIASIFFTYFVTSILDMIKWRRHFKTFADQAICLELEETKNELEIYKEELSKLKMELANKRKAIKIIKGALIND